MKENNFSQTFVNKFGPAAVDIYGPWSISRHISKNLIVNSGNEPIDWVSQRKLLYHACL